MDAAQRNRRNQRKAKEAQRRRDAEAGDARAMYNLGTAYANGDGVFRDLSQAQKWLQRARLAGHRGDNLDRLLGFNHYDVCRVLP